MTIDRVGATSTVARPGLLPGLKGVAALFAALVLFQAFLAGRGWFQDFDLIDVHGVVGMAAVLPVAALQAVLSFLVAGRAGARGAVPLAGAALLLLVILQIVLGTAGEDSAAAAAWHIPNGVLIFGLATANTANVFRLGRV